MAYFMVAVHYRKPEGHGHNLTQAGFRVLQAEFNKKGYTVDKVIDCTSESAYSIIKNGTAMIHNLGIVDDEVVGNNGALTRYPKIVGGSLIGNSPLIVLQASADGGYIVADYNGTVVKVSRQEAIRYAQTEGISNGKVVSPSDEGAHPFISCISGSYLQEETFDESGNAKKMQIKLDMVNGTDYRVTDYNQIFMLNLNLEEVKVPNGITRIAPKGFADMRKLKRVSLPVGLWEIGTKAFLKCTALEEIVIPDGVQKLGASAFWGCSKLKKVTLPNSIVTVESGTFTSCPKLKAIETGPAHVTFEFGAMPSGVVISRRKA